MFTRRNSKQKKKETVPKKRNIRASPRPEILLNPPPKQELGSSKTYLCSRLFNNYTTPQHPQFLVYLNL
jgi:hypothetical protein